MPDGFTCAELEQMRREVLAWLERFMALEPGRKEVVAKEYMHLDLWSILEHDPDGTKTMTVHGRQPDLPGGIYPLCICGAQWLEQANRCVTQGPTVLGVNAMIVTRTE